MIKYRTTTSRDSIKEWKKLILQHRIHFHWGESGIREVCEDASWPTYAIAMAFDGDTPIGAAIIADHIWGCNIMVYVKSKYRRKGIGTKLIKSVRGRDVRQLTYDCYDNDYRFRFYTKAGVLNG